MKPLTSIEILLCRSQAKIFEASVDKTCYSSAIFIRRFMYSSIGKSFDDKLFLYRTESIEDVFDLMDEEFGKSSYGKIKYTKDQMFWIGYIYRVICIKYNLSSRSVYKLFNGQDIVKYYNICHTFDAVDAAERMMESINYCEPSIEETAYKYMKRLLFTEKLVGFLGKDVEVFVDRPIGYNHEGIIYTQNYGHIKELTALDNEYQDAYVIGVYEPLKTFKGKVIAVINRKNDIEDKLIVSDKNASFSKEEILRMVNFQEKYFKSKVILK